MPGRKLLGQPSMCQPGHGDSNDRIDDLESSRGSDYGAKMLRQHKVHGKHQKVVGFELKHLPFI